VRKIYEDADEATTREIFTKYKVKYVVVGGLERTKYLKLNEEKLAKLGVVVFSQSGTTIYRVD
jgi:uncharacterized membrane protein